MKCGIMAAPPPGRPLRAGGSKTAVQTVRRSMRGKRFVLGICGALVGASLLAQQTPIHGCNGAVTCNRPLGYTALTGNPSVFMGVGARFGPGFQFGLATPSVEVPKPETTGPDVR